MRSRRACVSNRIDLVPGAREPGGQGEPQGAAAGHDDGAAAHSPPPGCAARSACTRERTSAMSGIEDSSSTV